MQLGLKLINCKRSTFLIIIPYNLVNISVCKILENATLDLALKSEGFQGKPSKNPWNFNSHKPWIDSDFPWKHCPCPYLGFWGFSRINLEKPWSQNTLHQGPWKSLMEGTCCQPMMSLNGLWVNFKVQLLGQGQGQRK